MLFSNLVVLAGLGSALASPRVVRRRCGRTTSTSTTSISLTTTSSSSSVSTVQSTTTDKSTTTAESTSAVSSVATASASATPSTDLPTTDQTRSTGSTSGTPSTDLTPSPSSTTTSSTVSESTSATSSVAVPQATFSFNETPASPLKAPDTASYLAVQQTDAALLELLGGLPFSSYLNKTDGSTVPIFSTTIDGHLATFDLSDPSRLQFCDTVNSNCFSLRADGLHIFPSSGGEVIIAYDPPPAPSTVKRADIVQRVVLPTRTPDPQFTAYAGFVDRCQTPLKSLDPVPEFFFDTVPCDNSRVSDGGNTYKGVCKYVTAMEFGCRKTAKAIIDKSIGSDSIFKDLDVIGKYLGGSKGVQLLVTRAATYLAALGIESAIAAGAVVAAGAEFIFAAVLVAAVIRQFVDLVGSENIAILWCQSGMVQCESCFQNMRSPHDLVVKALGESFTIASISEFPESFVAQPNPFTIKGYTANTKRQEGGSCSIPDNRLRNGGFEDDGDIVKWPNGQGWWLPEAPSDRVEFSSWDGWQVTTGTDPQATIIDSGCFKGSRCLQAYAIASPGGSGGARIYQLMNRDFIPGAAYKLSFSYRIDLLGASGGALGGRNYCYIFSHFQFSDVGQPGYMRLDMPVAAEWKTVTRTFNYQATDPRATTDEFEIYVACMSGPGVTMQLAVTLDELSVVPV